MNAKIGGGAREVVRPAALTAGGSPAPPSYRYTLRDVDGRLFLRTNDPAVAQRCARNLARLALVGEIETRRDYALRARFDALMQRILVAA